MTLLYLDANIFLTWLKKEEKDPKFYQGVKQLIREIEEGKYQVIASPILSIEMPYREEDKEDIERFNKMFEGFEVYPVDMRVADQVKYLRSRFKIKKIPDAIHLATAILHKAKYLCTNDSDLLKLAEEIKETKIVKLPPLNQELGI